MADELVKSPRRRAVSAGCLSITITLRKQQIWLHAEVSRPILSNSIMPSAITPAEVATIQEVLRLLCFFLEELTLT